MPWKNHQLFYTPLQKPPPSMLAILCSKVVGGVRVVWSFTPRRSRLREENVSTRVIFVTKEAARKIGLVFCGSWIDGLAGVSKKGR